MWFVTLRSPVTSPVDYKLKPGGNSLGRKPDNDIVIPDESASRAHAEIFCQEDSLVITDMNSTNGTYVNHERISGPKVLRSKDQIRIGKHIAIVTYREDSTPANLVAALSGTRPLTRELVLEAVDHNSMLLYEVANRLTTILDLKTSIQEIAKLMRSSMGADKCEIIMADQFEHLSDLGFPTSIASQAIDQRSVVIIPDLSSLNGHTPSKSAILLQIRSVLCVPVLIETDVVALIYVYKTNPTVRPFDQNDVQIAVAISYQTALTIQRANLLEHSRVLEEKINFDDLTGLYNRNHFIDLAENEFQRALRFKHFAMIMMMDIDDFKHTNDTYGHLAGDHVLQNVAVRCRHQIREIDLLGRFGGDEFIFFLIETDPVEGRAIADRIRLGISENPFDTERGPISISVSMGVAVLTPDSMHLTALINIADNALYEAKNAGKNQVVVR
jgi:diguanylate cyclase (GGDEF)-like protein